MAARSMSPGARLGGGVAILAVGAILAAVALWLLARGADGARKPLPEPAPAAAMELAIEDVVTVERRTLVRRLPVSGSVTPLTQALIKSKVAGEVLEVAFREGETVRRGDMLLRIDTRSLEAGAASARAALAKSRADLELARLNFANAERLFARKVLAENDLDTKRSLFDAAAAAGKLAEAQLRIAEIALDDARVRAPFDGVIARRMVHPGGKVSPDTPLFELVDLAHMEVQVAAPAAEIASVRPGQVARLSIDGFGGRRFEARLERISPTAEQGSRLVLLYLAIDNPDGALRGGMFAQGDLLIAQSEAVLALPASAVFNESGLDYVMGIRDGKLERRRVRIGPEQHDGEMLEVEDGVAAGEQVLARRIASLDAGAAVRLPAQPQPRG